MAEVLDETPALDDPLFIEIWKGINLKKQLEEAHRQLSIATSMPETAEKTYLILIDNYKQELETWFLDESDNEQHYMRLYKGMEVLRHEIMNCNDAVEVMELFDNFKSKFAEINKDTELEKTYGKQWDGLERKTRELVRNLTKFLLDASAKIIELNEEICKCKENYEVLRLGILRSAENQIAEKMTKRYQKMRLDFLKDISRIIQEKHEQLQKEQIKLFMDQVNERKQNLERVNELKTELRRLRIQYYTEPIEMERNLEQFRDQVLENDQKIALLTSELKHLNEEVKQADPVSSLRPEISTGKTAIYDIPENSDNYVLEKVENEIVMIDVPNP